MRDNFAGLGDSSTFRPLDIQTPAVSSPSFTKRVDGFELVDTGDSFSQLMKIQTAPAIPDQYAGLGSAIKAKTSLELPYEREPRPEAEVLGDGEFRKQSPPSIGKQLFRRGDLLPIGGTRKGKIIDFSRRGRDGWHIDLEVNGRPVAIAV